MRVSSRDFTLAVATALQQAAWGGRGAYDAPPGATGGVAVAASAYARALSSASVNGPDPVAAALLAVLPCAGEAYVRYGEFAALPAFTDDGLHLQPVEIVEGAGSHAAPRWTVRCYDPNGDYEDRVVAAAELLHVVWHPDASGLRGCPPWAGELGRVAANIERSLADEGRMPLGQALLLHSAAELDDEAVDEFYDAAEHHIADRGGFTPWLLQGASNLEGGPGLLKRYGPEYCGAAPQLLDGLMRAVGAACGLPPVLLSENVGGSAYRDAWRTFVSSAVQPVADSLARAATAVLGVDLAIEARARHNTPADLVSRARAAGSLEAAGVETTRALEIVGLEDMT